MLVIHKLKPNGFYVGMMQVIVLQVIQKLKA